MNVSNINKNPYPLDLDGIKMIGIENWLENYQPPLHGQKFQEIYKKIINIYADSMNQFDSSSNIYLTCVINYKMILIISNVYYKFALLMKLKKKGCKTISRNGRNIDIDSAIEQDMQHSFLMNEYKSISLKNVIKERLRYIKQNSKTHGILKSIAKECNGNICVIGGTEDPYLNSYFKEHNYTPEYIRPLTYMSGSKQETNKSDLDALDIFINYFIDNLREFDDYNYFNDNFKSRFRKLSLETLTLLTHFSKNLNRKEFPPLLVDSIHYNYSRIISAVWHSKGGKVIALAHGNSYLTGVKAGPLSNGSLLMCDTFLTPSPGEKMQLDYGRSIEKSKMMSSAELFMFPSVKLKNLYKAEQKKNLQKITQIKKVLFIGYPIDYSFYPGLPGHDTLNYIHLTFMILKSLREHGYYISYKDHPDTLNETTGFFDEYVDEIKTENFDDVFHDYDCIIYPSPYTTTFGIGMLSNIPIVYVDNTDWNLWHPDIKLLLDKRAVGFKVSADDNGVVKFVKDDLNDCINLALNKIDHTVVEKFAF